MKTNFFMDLHFALLHIHSIPFCTLDIKSEEIVKILYCDVHIVMFYCCSVFRYVV